MLEMPGTGTTTPADMDLVWQVKWRIMGFGGCIGCAAEFVDELVPLLEFSDEFGVSWRLFDLAWMLLLDMTSAVLAGEARDTCCGGVADDIDWSDGDDCCSGRAGTLVTYGCCWSILATSEGLSGDRKCVGSACSSFILRPIKL